MRKYFFLLLLMAGSYNALAQVNTADSLKQLIATSKEDTNRVLWMRRLAIEYIISDPDTSLHISGEALALARKISYKRGEASLLRLSGNVFTNQGNYPRALENYLQSYKISEELQDPLLIGSALGNLSNVYFYAGDYRQSIDYSHRAISTLQKYGGDTAARSAIQNLGDTYEKLGILDSGLLYTRIGYRLAMPSNLISAKITSLINMGNVLFKLGELDSAKIFYLQAMPYINEEEDNVSFCECATGMARVLLRQKKSDSSLYYAREAFQKARSGGFTDQMLAASTFLADYYHSTGNVDSAYRYQSVTVAAKDSLFDKQKMNQMQSLTYDETARQQQIDEARQQERNQLKQGVLIGGLGAVLLVAALLYRNNRQKIKANVLLQAQKREIDNQVQELSVQKANLEQSYHNVEQLGEIGRKISASLSVEKIISTVYNNVNALMDAAVFGIGIYNPTKNQLDFPATYEEGQALPFYSTALDDNNRFAALCFRDEKEIVMGNLSEEYRRYTQEVLTPHEGKLPVSLIYLPLVAKGKIRGVITVQSFERDAYTDYHLFMLRNIAIYTAIALENAESFDTLNDTVVRLKSTQAQLIQSEKMASLGELTAGIAHEIQNPLNFVNNFSEVNQEWIDEAIAALEQGNTNELKGILDNLKDNQQKINHHGKRADSIVKGMLQHSRSSLGQKEPTNINTLSDEYLRLAYHGLRAKDKSFNSGIKTELDDSLPNIDIIPQDIGRVILNIITNAFYAVDEKKKQNGQHFDPLVILRTKALTASSPGSNGSSAKQLVEISISDNGNGIPQQILDKIFQPFFTTKPTGQGTGLGLSLAYDIVKAHGGSLRVETRNGEGVTFIIQLPAK